MWQRSDWTIRQSPSLKSPMGLDIPPSPLLARPSKSIREKVHGTFARCGWGINGRTWKRFKQTMIALHSPVTTSSEMGLTQPRFEQSSKLTNKEIPHNQQSKSSQTLHFSRVCRSCLVRGWTETFSSGEALSVEQTLCRKVCKSIGSGLQRMAIVTSKPTPFNEKLAIEPH